MFLENLFDIDHNAIAIRYYTSNLLLQNLRKR